jgi:hypothetical protein
LCRVNHKPVKPRSVALDYRLGISYLASMAIRLLLTLLALMTGLAAQLSPAQARVGAGSDTEIGEVAGAVASQGRHSAIALVCPPLQRLGWRPRTVRSLEPTRTGAVLPAVLQGIDRARE